MCPHAIQLIRGRCHSHPMQLTPSSSPSCRAGLPVSNDETDSNKSGSSHSDPYHSTLLYPHQHQPKGKQLPKGMHLNTMELLDLTNDEDSANSRRLDRQVLSFKLEISFGYQSLTLIFF